MTGNRKRLLIGRCLRTLALAAWVLAGTTAVPCAASPATAAPQEVFPDPEHGVESLIAANRSNDLVALRRILGPAGTKLIESGDAVADRNARARFVAAYDEAHRIGLSGADKAVLSVGAQEWPMPIPLIRAPSGWRFDTEAGKREILDRRIGRNELSVIEVCREYVKAQREYASMNARDGAAPDYAQHLMSRDDKRDGLYWPSKPDEAESPLGPLVARAHAAGYPPGGPLHASSQPYYGYYFRILTRQGTHASGGPKNYIVNGRMAGGFGMIAFPARYGDSGIMTFIVSADGIVFEKNLGRHTERLVRSIDQYDPDPTWRTP